MLPPPTDLASAALAFPLLMPMAAMSPSGLDGQGPAARPMSFGPPLGPYLWTHPVRHLFDAPAATAGVAGGRRVGNGRRRQEGTVDDVSEKARKSWVLALVSVASFMVALDALVVTTALSTIRLDFGASIEALQWTVNAYNLSFAVLLMTGAALGDRFGRRRLLAVGLGLFVAASAACALAPGIGWLIAARAVQGAGAALVMPLAMALLSAAFPREQRGQALGIFSGVTGLALIAGPLVGGAVVEGIAWQWIFWINLPIGLLVIPLVLARIPESYGPGTVLDIPGLALVAGAALGVVWGLMRGNSAGWGSLEVVATLAAGLLLALAFVPGSDAPASRWCRRDSFAPGPSQRRTPWASCSTRRSTAPSSSCHSSCRSYRATGRSGPGCDCSPGPPPCSWSHRSPAASSTGSASGRSSSSGCSRKRSGWPGSG